MVRTEQHKIILNEDEGKDELFPYPEYQLYVNELCYPEPLVFVEYSSYLVCFHICNRTEVANTFRGNKSAVYQDIRNNMDSWLVLNGDSALNAAHRIKDNGRKGLRTSFEYAMALRKEEFRLLHTKVTSPEEDVMQRYYGIDTNNCSPIRIPMWALARLLNRYSYNGVYLIIADEENDKSVKQTISTLKRSGYLYLPLYRLAEGKYLPYFLVFNVPSKDANPTVKLDFTSYKWIPSEPFYYVNPMPNQLTERMRRQREVMIWK